MPTWEHVESHLPGQMPVLEISEGFREAAMLVGIVLMLMTAIDKLVQHSTPRQIFGSLVAGRGGGRGCCTPVRRLTSEDLGNYNLLIFFFGLVAVSMAIGMPIAFSFLLATVAYLQFSTTVPVLIVPGRRQRGNVAHGAACCADVRAARRVDRNRRPGHGR